MPGKSSALKIAAYEERLSHKSVFPSFRRVLIAEGDCHPAGSRCHIAGSQRRFAAPRPGETVETYLWDSLRTYAAHENALSASS
jgi:hypothetical protein